jgi:hypothetical protein
MGTLNLTTADNYLTVIVNGTTIKQLWAKQGDNGTPVKVYQKWKTTHVTQYTNTLGNTYRGGGCGVNYKYESGRNSYCIYRLKTVLSVSVSRSIKGRAYIAGYFNGSLERSSPYWNGEGSQLEYLDDCVTAYASYDSSYDEKTYACIWRLYTSSGSSTSAGYGRDGVSNSSIVYTPFHTESSTGAKEGTSAYVSGDSYQGVDTSYDVREEDN